MSAASSETLSLHRWRHPKNTKLFSYVFLTFEAFKTIYLPRYTPKNRTIKKFYFIGKNCYVVLCPALQTVTPTGEAAKLTDDVTQISS